MKEFSELSENEKFQELFRLMAFCLFGSQRVEFILQALVGLFSNQFNDKQYKNITPKSFYKDSESGKKLRKKTLGALTLKTKEIEIINSERLEKYVFDRNFIVHNLWRENLNEKLNEKKLNESVVLCLDFLEETEKIEKSFYGFLNVLNKYLEKQNIDLDPELTNNLKRFEDDLKEFFK